MNPRTKWTILLILGCMLILIAACSPPPACVPIYDVTKSDDTNDGACSPGDCSLREAVNNANACPGSQIINLPADGYTLTLDGDDENLGETGDLDVTDDLVIIGTGVPSINGNIERAFHIHSGVTATFEGILLMDGDAIYGGGLVNEGFLTLNNFTCNYNHVSIPPGGMGDAMGGCIFNASNLIINNGHFLANTAGYGGAIYNYDHGTATIENGSFTGNEADYHGGAIWVDVDAEININNSAFDQNEAGVNGGAVWSHGDVHSENSVFEDNTTPGNGGALYLWEGFATFTNSWLTLNTADLGGGVYNDHGMLHFYQSGLTANAANGGMGGGIYNYDSSPSYATGGLLMYNTTVSNNTAPGGGAGIYNSGNFDLRFITVADNNPEGIRIDAGAEIKIRSSILSNNTGGDCAGNAPDSLDYNLDSDNSCVLTGGNDLLGANPFLEPLGFHGSTAPSHPLGHGSPALDSGVPDLCTAIDQNGTTRPQGPWCDRGAFENIYTKGIVWGWTYIDVNNNDQRDPTEGPISGAILTLKDGPCPGGADVMTRESNPDGYYRFLEIEPGDYCLATSPIQQTLDPTFYDLSFEAGDVLEDINFRYLLSSQGISSINGKVWHDNCVILSGIIHPPGCLNLSAEGLIPDGIYNPSESGIEGVLVQVYVGGCSVSPGAFVGADITDVNGDFSIPGLSAGSWCVTVDALAAPNDTRLLPGNWSYPVRNAAPAEHEVVLGVSEDLTDINFGWDYELRLPPPIPYSCPADMNAFIRLGPSTNYPKLFTTLKGEIFEILAKSEPGIPVWYFGHTEAMEEGWVSAAVLACEEPEPENLYIRATPLLPEPEKEPGDDILLTCKRDLSKDDCEAAGGTMSTGATTAPYCICH